MTAGDIVTLIIALCMLATAILICRRPPHDPDGVGVDLSGQGREPKAETPPLPIDRDDMQITLPITLRDQCRFTASQNSDFIRDFVACHKGNIGIDAGHDDTEGTPI
jgi:hypothetical protein